MVWLRLAIDHSPALLAKRCDAGEGPVIGRDMSELELLQAIARSLERIEFFSHVAALAACWIAGGLGWHWFVYGKNQRGWW